MLIDSDFEWGFKVGWYSVCLMNFMGWLEVNHHQIKLGKERNHQGALGQGN